MELSQKDIDRFWRYVDIKEQNDCWNWKKSCYVKGYGQFFLNYKKEKTNRIALILSHCPQQENKTHALHLCKQNRKCCNPTHLYWGNHDDNMKDKVNDDTQTKPKGIKNVNSKLTEQQVLEIRKKYLSKKNTMKKIADEYNVSKSSISCIINFKTWTHI